MQQQRLLTPQPLPQQTRELPYAESDIKNLMKVIDEIQTQYNTKFSQLQLMAQRSELKLEVQFTKLASQKVSLRCLTTLYSQWANVYY